MKIRMKKPKHLNEKSHSKYEELYRIVEGILKPGDENLLAVLANTYINYDIANAILMERPPVQGGAERTYKSPLHDMVKENIKIISELSAHFGLSPKSRGDKLDGGGDKKDKLDTLLGE